MRIIVRRGDNTGRERIVRPQPVISALQITNKKETKQYE